MRFQSLIFFIRSKTFAKYKLRLIRKNIGKKFFFTVHILFPSKVIRLKKRDFKIVIMN